MCSIGYINQVKDITFALQEYTLKVQKQSLIITDTGKKWIALQQPTMTQVRNEKIQLKILKTKF